MKTIVLFFALALTGVAHAKTWGLGAVIGDPTGLSANYFLSENRSLHSVLAYDIDGDDQFYFASHYTWRRPNAFDLTNFNLGWFYGAGAQLEFHDHDHDHGKHRHHHDNKLNLGPSGTLGLFHQFEKVPLEVFLKSNLTLYVFDSTDLDLDLMLGLHYNF